MAADKHAIKQVYMGRKFIGEGKGVRGERRERKTETWLLRETAEREEEWEELVS